MADLLLELLSEEIPARMQQQALKELSRALLEGLQKEQFAVKQEQFHCYVTPRRLAVWIEGLASEQSSVETELKGPKVGAAENALLGFLKKTGLAREALTERDGSYFGIVRKEGRKTAEALKIIIEQTLTAFPWPKSMRWGDTKITSGSKELRRGQERYGSPEPSWVRPLHSILCLFDGKVIPVEFAGLTASNVTRGHRFLSPLPITIHSPAEYEATLDKEFVIADRDARKEHIRREATALAEKHGLRLRADEGLLEEVTGLVEWPVALLGSIDASFMDLPGEVLVSEMRAHQKYFALEKPDGSLADRFIVIANMLAKDDGKAITSGNERVLRARLADGRFFWDTDRKKPPSEWAAGLQSVTYHAKLGSYADKVGRVKALALTLADAVFPSLREGKADEAIQAGSPRCARDDEKALVSRAAELCKADLVTGMVGEFPELQGVMGRYYALQQGEPQEVADAIRDHYKPQGPSDAVPNQPVSICLALADKLDTLVGMFAIGEKPTGSKDPYALRRAALGVIRIVLENSLVLNLKPLIINHLNTLARTTLSSYKDSFLSRLKNLKEEANSSTLAQALETYETHGDLAVQLALSKSEAKLELSELSNELATFFIDRLKVQLKDQGIRHDVINAVVAGGDDDLVRIVARAKALQDFLTSEDGANLLALYRRAANILRIEQEKDKIIYHFSELDSDKLIESAEKELGGLLSKTQAYAKTKLTNEDFGGAMTILATLRQPVDQFFDQIMVNCEDRDLRANRLRLLSAIRESMDSVADFSKIEG